MGIVGERLASALSNPMALQTGDLRFVDLEGPGSHAVMTTAGGQVALYRAGDPQDMLTSAEVIRDIAGTQASLSVGRREGRAVLSVDSWLANAEDHTLQILDAETLDLVAAIDAGRVLGTALVGLDSDGNDEVLVGTQDGWLRAYDQALDLVFEWSAGDLNVGENGTIRTMPVDEGTVVAFPVAGGWRVLFVERL